MGNELDNFLHRNLKNGGQYDSLFPVTTCEKVALGKGDTDYSIEKMVDWIIEHQDHTAKVAKTLSKSSLQYTCEAIHQFLFDHFQYKADDEDQLLRSPACAWQQRFDGIDCKSYSIVASSCLLNLNIVHYIRKVGYIDPEEFTHVYVIVPKNQKTGSLKDGYYMIDGTIDTMQEPYFLVEKDEFMNLPHYGLKKPNAALNGLNLRNLNFNSIKSFIQSIQCWGGSAYTNGILDSNINKATGLYNDMVVAINANIQTGNLTEVAKQVFNFIALTYRLGEGSWASRAEGWNSCSTSNFDAFIKIVGFFENTAYPALIAYIDKYFNKTIAQTFTTDNRGMEAQGWFFMEHSDPEYYFYHNDVPLYALTLKPGVTSIPAFEFTQPIVNVLEQGADFNIEEFLATLQTIVWAVSSNTGSGNGNGTGTGGTYEDQTGTGNNPTPTKTAGFGTIAGIGIITAALMFAFNSTPDKPTKKLTTNEK